MQLAYIFLSKNQQKKSTPKCKDQTHMPRRCPPGSRRSCVKTRNRDRRKTTRRRKRKSAKESRPRRRTKASRARRPNRQTGRCPPGKVISSYSGYCVRPCKPHQTRVDGKCRNVDTDWFSPTRRYGMHSSRRTTNYALRRTNEQLLRDMVLHRSLPRVSINSDFADRFNLRQLSTLM